MEQLINKAVAYVQAFFAEDHSGHDAQHTLRVWRMAKRIAAEEGADQLTVQMAALLHDVDDRKLSPETWQDKRNARQFMQESGVDEAVQRHVLSIISSISFSAGLVPDTLEGKIVQDADRLDAMGAIGIARTFAYGGSHGRTMYDPAEKPDEYMSRQEYAARTSSSITAKFSTIPGSTMPISRAVIISFQMVFIGISSRKHVTTIPLPYAVTFRRWISPRFSSLQALTFL